MNATINELVELAQERGCLSALDESLQGSLKTMRTSMAEAAAAGRPLPHSPVYLRDLEHEAAEVRRLLAVNTTGLDRVACELMPDEC